MSEQKVIGYYGIISETYSLEKLFVWDDCFYVRYANNVTDYRRTTRAYPYYYSHVGLLTFAGFVSVRCNDMHQKILEDSYDSIGLV
jgi:hypothetical protein